MAFQHALSTNNYGPAKLIVSTSAANGTHTTLAGAMADAVSGDTIFLRDSVTENVTLTAGVNISAWQGGTLNTPTIIGTLTMTTAGTCNISGIRLQTNSSAILAVTGSAASIVNIDNCYLNCTNNTGITFSSSSGSAEINLNNCKGDLGTTVIGIFNSSSAGILRIFQSNFTNSGSSLTTNATTASAGTISIQNSMFNSPMTSSGTAIFNFKNSYWNCGFLNVISLTLGGSGGQTLNYCHFTSGTASSISISSSATLNYCTVVSTNTNPITGAGSLSYTPVNFLDTGNTINTTTRNPLNYGTWTPTLDGSTPGTTTYTTQQGYYTIVGNLVYIEGLITITAATGTGSAQIGALPFAVKNPTNYRPAGTISINGVGWAWPALTTSVILRPNQGNSFCGIIASGNAVAASNVQMSNAAVTLTFSSWYQI